MDQNHLFEDYLCNIILIFLSLKIYQEYSHQNSLYHALTSVEEKPDITTDALRFFLEKNKTHKLKKSYKNPFNPDETIFTNFIVKGYVQAAKPHLYSKYNKNMPIVFRINFKSPFYNNSAMTLQNDLDFIKNNEISQEMTNFSLSDNKNSVLPSFISFKKPAILCNILKNPDVEWIFLEEDKTFSKKNKNHGNSIFDKLRNFLSFILKPLSFRPNFLVIGLEEKEFAIKIGSYLGVLGNVIYNYKEKSLRIEKPLFFFKEKKYLVDFIKKNIVDSRKTLQILVFGAISLVCLKIYQMMHNSMSDDNLIRTFPGNEIYTNMDENLVCPQCQLRTKNMVLMPCKHLSFCEECYYLVKDNEKSRCPCCKQRFDNFYKIYIV